MAKKKEEVTKQENLCDDVTHEQLIEEEITTCLLKT